MRGLAQGAARGSWSAGEQLSNSNAKNNNGEKRKKKNDTPGGTRTRNPQIRSLMRYPLRHWGTWEF